VTATWCQLLVENPILEVSKNAGRVEDSFEWGKFDVEIKTKNYVERTLTLLKEGQIYVIFDGGTGTISEFGMAWGLAKLYFGHHKPLILYGKFWENIVHAFKDNMILRPEELEVYKIVESVDGVLQAISDFEQELKHGQHRHVKATTDDFSI